MNPKNLHPLSEEAVAKRLKLTRIAVMQLEDNQAAFCDITGIDPRRWNNAETGDNPVPHDIAMVLAERFGVGLDWTYRNDIRALPPEYRDLVMKAEKGLLDGSIRPQKGPKKRPGVAQG